MNRAIIIIIFIFLFSIGIKPQSASADATVSVQIITPLSITTSGNLDFSNNVSAPNSYHVNKSPDQGSIFLIKGDPNRSVTITYSQVTLSNQSWVSKYGGTASTIAFVPEVKQTGAQSTYINPISVVSGSQYVIANNAGLGELYIWVGGTLLINANQAPGGYNGVFSLSIAY